jgi:hypothetical protein
VPHLLYHKTSFFAPIAHQNFHATVSTTRAIATGETVRTHMHVKNVVDHTLKNNVKLASKLQLPPKIIVALCQHISLMVEHLEDALLCILPQKCESLAAVMEHPALHLFRTFSYPF